MNDKLVLYFESIKQKQAFITMHPFYVNGERVSYIVQSEIDFVDFISDRIKMFP